MSTLCIQNPRWLSPEVLAGDGGGLPAGAWLAGLLAEAPRRQGSGRTAPLLCCAAVCVALCLPPVCACHPVAPLPSTYSVAHVLGHSPARLVLLQMTVVALFFVYIKANIAHHDWL